jgi:hypothetical protein
MTLTNYVLLQVFYSIPESVVIGLLPVLAAFNISQALINIVPSLMITDRIRQRASAIIHQVTGS